MLRNARWPARTCGSVLLLLVAQLDAVMTELVEFAGRHPDAVAETPETAAA